MSYPGQDIPGEPDPAGGITAREITAPEGADERLEAFAAEVERLVLAEHRALGRKLRAQAKNNGAAR